MVKRIPFFISVSAQLFALFSFATTASAQETNKSVKIIEPNSNIVKAEAADISGGNFELGLSLGMLSVEDFNTNRVDGLNFTYHINQDFNVSLQIGRSDVDRASFEDNSGGDFVDPNERTFEYTSLVGGYRLFHGRSFSSEKSKFNSNIYLLFGTSSVDYAGKSETGVILGSSYKTVLNHWLTWDLTLKDHIVDRTFLDDSKQTHNVELSLGINVLF